MKPDRHLFASFVFLIHCSSFIGTTQVLSSGFLTASDRSQAMGGGVWVGQPPAAQPTLHPKRGEAPQVARGPEELRLLKE